MEEEKEGGGGGARRRLKTFFGGVDRNGDKSEVREREGPAEHTFLHALFLPEYIMAV